MLNDFSNLQVEGENPVKIKGLISLANNAKIQGKYQDATQHYLHILEIAFHAANQQLKAIALSGLGSVLTCSHQYEIAVEYHQQQLKLAANIDDVVWEADAICSLGYIFCFLKDYDKAIELQTRCLEIINKFELPEIQARRLRCLGIVNYERQQYQTAFDFYTQSIKIYQKIKSPLEEAETIVNLAIAEREAKRSQAVVELSLVDLEPVLDNLYKAHSISDRLGNSTLKSKTLQELAITYEIAGNIDIAINKCNSALQIAKEFDLKVLVEECQKLIDQYTENEKKQEYIVKSQPWYVSELPQPQVISETECQSIKDTIDVVIITATHEELKAIRNLLKPYSGREQVLKVFTLSGTYYLGKIGTYNIVVTKCQMGGTSRADSSTLSTYEALIEWHPRAVIMIGIAFGKDSSKQNIGDVLVASEIIFYEQQRIGVEGIIDRGIIPPSDETLFNRFDNAQEWKFIRPDGTPCLIITGPILSGEKLVDDPDFKANLFKRYPHSIGGEMEGTGLCAAARKCKIPWILLKSICDWADGTKQEKYQPLAAASSANLVHYVLSQPYVLDSLKKS